MPDWKEEARRRIAPLKLDPAREAEIVEEVAQDADDRCRALMDGGLSRADAERRIRDELRLGAWADALRGVAARAPHPAPALGAPARAALLADLGQDVRYGLRMLRKSPLAAAAAILTLTLGIGASTTMFSVVNTVLLQPLPFPDPDRLVSINGANSEAGWSQQTLSHANFWDLTDLAGAFSDIGAITYEHMSLRRREASERISAARVSAGFLRALGVQPLAGRIFADGEDDERGDSRVVVLSHREWVARFGADPAAVGTTLTLDGQPYVIVGALPPGTPILDAADVFVPLVRPAEADRDSFELEAIGRLRPGVTEAQAAADLSRVARALRERHPTINKGFDMVLRPLRELIAGEVLRRTLWVLMGAVGCLLLIACVNLVNLLLAQASARTREVALRASLGASRTRIVRQLVAETLVLGGIGGALGLAAAFAGVRLLRGVDAGIARLAFVEVDGAVLAFTIAITLGTSVATGLASALQASRAALTPALREGERGATGSRRQRRTRQLLVAAEVALSVTLLIGAGLLLRSFDEVMRTERGFATEGRLMLQLTPPEAYDAERTWQLIDAFTSRARTLPGVVSAAAVSARPLVSGSTGLGLGAPGRNDTGEEVPWGTWRLITQDYFRTLGVPLLQGRVFTNDDIVPPDEPGRAPLRVVISRRVATLLYPNENPIGRTIVLWKGQSDRKGEIVGVVGDMRERGLAEEPTLAVYFPYRGVTWDPVQIVLHTTADTTQLLPALRSFVAAIDPDVPISDVQTLDSLVAVSVASRRFTLYLLMGFAGLALILAVGGIHGVLSYVIARRTSEIGLRVALGADRTSVLRLVVKQGMTPVLAGLAAGLIVAIALSGLMTGLLFGVKPTDPITYVGVGLVIAIGALAACLVPARRALQVDVMTALRTE